MSADRLADDFVGRAQASIPSSRRPVSADRLADDFVGKFDAESTFDIRGCQQIAWPTTSSADVLVVSFRRCGCQQIAWPTTSSASRRENRQWTIQGVSADRLADDFVGDDAFVRARIIEQVSADRLADDFVGSAFWASLVAVIKCQQIAWPTTSSAARRTSNCGRN